MTFSDALRAIAYNGFAVRCALTIGCAAIGARASDAKRDQKQATATCGATPQPRVIWSCRDLRPDHAGGCGLAAAEVAEGLSAACMQHHPRPNNSNTTSAVGRLWFVGYVWAWVQIDCVGGQRCSAHCVVHVFS